MMREGWGGYVRFIKDRLPHVVSHQDIWGGAGRRVIRVYGIRPQYRFCLFDYTRSNFSAGQIGQDSIRVSLIGFVVYSRPGTIS